MAFAGGQRTTGKQSWSQDIGTSEKDEFFPLYPALRTDAFSTACQPAGRKWTVHSEHFPPLPFLTHLFPPETLVFHLGSRLTYFLQQCVNGLVALHCVTFNVRSFKWKIFSSFLCDCQVYVLSNSLSYHFIPRILTSNRIDHWLFDLVHLSEESMTLVVFLQQPALKFPKLHFLFVVIKRNDAHLF